MRERVKGWRRDRDDWLTRPTRYGDPTEKWFNTKRKDSCGTPYDCLGFICEGIVYVREPEHAREFDKARK